MLTDMLPDRVTLIKPDGRRFENIPASVSPKKIIIDDAKLPLEEGDHFERRLKSGLTELYEVLDRGFYEGMHGIPDHYQADVRKTTAIPRTPATQTVIYNLHGANARVNIHSTDSSMNVVSVSADALFSELRKALERSVADETERRMLIKTIAELEAAEGTDGFIAKYAEFMSLAANHITVLAPFVPALSQLLTMA
jgi:hypothetical protein